jgi:hypothetical protein
VYRIFGVRPHEVQSDNEFWLNRDHPEDPKRIQELFEKSEMRKTGYESHYRIVLPDGAVNHLHAIGHPIVKPNPTINTQEITSFRNPTNFRNAGILLILVFSVTKDWNPDCHHRSRVVKIQRSSREQVTYMVSGQIEEEDIGELDALIRSEAKGRGIVLDLKNLTLVGQDAIDFLDGCEANGITLKNCPAYIREWIKGQRGEK